MMRNMVLILKLYVREKTFAFMGLLFLLVVLGRPEAAFGQLLKMSTDFSWWGGVLWVTGVALTFLLGPFIKIQFAQARAHLVPHYRQAHFLGFVVVVVILFGSALWGIGRFFDTISWPLSGRLDIVLSGCLIVILNMGLAYLSMAPVFFIFYFLWCVASVPLYILAHEYGSIDQVNVVMAIMFVVGAILGSLRLFCLKEESVEYPHLFWKFESRSSTGDDGLRWLRSMGCWIESFLRIGSVARRAKPYAQIRGFWSKAFYLDAYRYRVILGAGALGLVLLPFYFFSFTAQKEALSVFISGQHKDFFLVVIPAMITVMVSGTRLFSGSTERLWPVDIRERVWGRVVVLQVQASFIWAGSFVLLVGFHVWIIGHTELYLSSRFLAEVFLTFLMSHVFLGLGLLSHEITPWKGRIIFVLLALSGVVSFQRLPLFGSGELTWVLAGWSVAWGFIWGNLVVQWFRAENNS